MANKKNNQVAELEELLTEATMEIADLQAQLVKAHHQIEKLKQSRAGYKSYNTKLKNQLVFNNA